MIAKISEEDVFDFYFPAIVQECQNMWRGLESEDRIQEGAIALLYAIRTYRPCYGPYQDFLKDRLQKYMEKQNSKSWAEMRLKSPLSMDAPLIADEDRNGFTLSLCLGENGIDESALDSERFFCSLTRREQLIVQMLLSGYAIKNIADKLSTSTYRINCVVRGLQKKYICYFNE